MTSAFSIYVLKICVAVRAFPACATSPQPAGCVLSGPQALFKGKAYCLSQRLACFGGLRPESMSRFYCALRDDPRRCRRCSRPCKLFGERDPETGWVGWCGVCVAEWKEQSFVATWRCCNRTCSIVSPVLCALGLPLGVVQTLNSFLFLTGPQIHILTMRRHKRALQLLECGCDILDWFLASQSSAYFEEDDPPTLWTLSKTYVEEFGPFARSCFSDADNGRRSLLDAVYTYLNPRFGFGPSDHTQHAETTLQLFHWEGALWLWDSNKGEWFFVEEPPVFWRRYKWFIGFPRCAGTLRIWWHNTESGRWFVEPTQRALQAA